MNSALRTRIKSDDLDQFAELLPAEEALFDSAKPKARLNVDPDDVKNGLGQLVLTLVKLLHELLERQAIRRMEEGSLSDAQLERLGSTLMLQAEQIERLRKEFGLEEEDLNLDLGPLGRLF